MKKHKFVQSHLMPKTKKSVIIIIPAFNEAGGIALLIRELRTRHPEFKLLVINDGSSDNTAEIAAREGADVVTLPCNLGIGGAVQTGFQVAFREGYDIACQVDGDAQHDPDYLPAIIAPVAEGKLDLCIGSRFLNAEATGFQSTAARRLGIRFFSVLLKTVTGIPLTDPTSGFRAANKKLIAHFAGYYPVDYPEPEVIQVARRIGARVGEVPVKMRKRLGGISSIRYLKTVYYMVKVTLAILIDTLKTRS